MTVSCEQMGHHGRRGPHMETVHPLLRGPIYPGHPLVLPQVLYPGCNQEGLDVAARIRRIVKQAPAHRAITPPGQSHGLHGLHELVGPPRINMVFDRHEHGAFVRLQGACDSGFWPVQRGPKIPILAGDEAVAHHHYQAAEQP